MADMFPVQSTRITEMGYDSETATVYVRFPNNKGWEYRNVPPNVWQDFVAADSKGRFIKDVLDTYDHGESFI